VVRLDRTDSDENSRTRLKRGGGDELELACLVASADESGQVVALDPDLGSTQLGTQAVERMERCWQGSQFGPRPLAEALK
jgi:hypothetical protein